jgi:hypothetical protein
MTDRSNLTIIILEAALRLAAERDWYVFPGLLIFDQAKGKWTKLSHRSKANSYSGLRWGMSKDPEIIRREFERCRPTAIGVPTGPNGFWVSEVDTRAGGHEHDGEENLQRLVAENGGSLPDTLRSRSPSGSVHRLWREPRDGGVPIISSYNEIAPGVDVVGQGGMVIVPPSRRGPGAYEWLSEDPLRHPILDAPDWHVEMARAASARNRSGNGGEYTPSADGHVPSADPDAPVEMIVAALSVLSNPPDASEQRPVNFSRWNRIGMSAHRGSDGHPTVFAAFDAFSRKNAAKYDAAATDRKWKGYRKSPITEITVASLFHFADEESPDWRDLCDEDVVSRHHTARDRRADEINAEAVANEEEYARTVMAEIAAEAAAEAGSLETAVVEAGASERNANADGENAQADATAPRADAARPSAPAAEGARRTNGAGATPPPLPPPPLRPFAPRATADIPPRRWLHAAHYIRGNVTMTVAPGGFGKSSLVIANAIEMVLGRGYLGPDPTEGAVRVAYWNIEDPAEEIERRIAAFCQQHTIDSAALAGRLFVGGRMRPGARFVKLDRRTGGAVVKREMFEALAIYIRDNEIDCVILDPFVAFHGVPENDNGLMELVVSEFKRLAEETGCCVELVHHTRKRQGGAGGELTDEDSRGASAVGYAARSIRVINRMTEDEAGACQVPPEERSAYLRVDRNKRNMAPPEKATWFHLASVALANGDDVQAVERWSYTAGDGRVDPALAIWAKEEVGRQPYKTAPQADGWFGHTLAARLGFAVDEAGVRRRIKVIISRLEIMGALARETRPDPVGRRVATYFHPGPWVPEAAEAAEERPF